ncbi:MAG: DUF5719 family protein [Candidatus Planktophila sp.]
MRLQRPVLLAIIAAIVMVTANALDVSLSTNSFSANYPPVVCPSTPTNLTTAISLTSDKTQLRFVGAKSLSTIPSQTLRYTQKKAPIIVESQNTTPVVWQFRNGIWAGATICSSLQNKQWFVGGSANVASKGLMLLVNSGLSPATVDLRIWNEVGEQPSKAIFLKENSFLEVRLDSLAPGSKELVVQTVTRAGRVTSYMLDERGRGLKALGGDVINFASSAEKQIYIPAIPHNIRKAGSNSIALSHSLRVLVPGELDASITVEIYSMDGSFIPTGLENRLVTSGSVVTLDLDPNLPPTKFGVKISSDQPLVAAVFSQTFAQGKSDFIWSTAAPKLSKFTLATSGLAPQLVFIGEKIDVSLKLALRGGKSRTLSIKGEAIAMVKIPVGASSVQIIDAGKDIYAAGLVTSKSGSGYFPLVAGSVLTKSAVPVSNIRVLTP